MVIFKNKILLKKIKVYLKGRATGLQGKKSSWHLLVHFPSAEAGLDRSHKPGIPPGCPSWNTGTRMPCCLLCAHQQVDGSESRGGREPRHSNMQCGRCRHRLNCYINSLSFSLPLPYHFSLLKVFHTLCIVILVISTQ